MVPNVSLSHASLPSQAEYALVTSHGYVDGSELKIPLKFDRDQTVYDSRIGARFSAAAAQNEQSERQIIA